MATINVSLPVDGDTIDSSDYNTPINTIVNEFNGNIDNSNIKAAAAIDGSKIAGGASGIANSNLNTTAGDIGGAWLAWTPTWTGLAGQPTTVARYTQIGKTIHFALVGTLTAGTLPNASAIIITLPVTAHASAKLEGSSTLTDASVTNYNGVVSLTSTTAITLQSVIASNAYSSVGEIGANTPFSWVATDSIKVSGTYEAA